MANPSVFIIGAGLAGLACGRVLAAAGVDVRIADKGRGPGGRCATRRSPAGRFDHGAAYFTVRDDAFLRAVEAWRKAGAAASWTPRCRKDGEVTQPDEAWFVGIPGMNAIIRHEAEALDAEFGIEIGAPMPGRDGRFDLSTRAGHQIADADFVVLATPAPQAAALLPGDHPLKARADQARYAPCWTLMAAIGDTDPGFDVFWPDDDRIDAIFWQPGKPQREPGGRFVVHASPEWSERHLEDDPDDVSDALLAAFAEASGVEGKPSHSAVHRWRYARVLDTADEDFGLDTDSGFATCGDWHMGPRIEAAWLSGHRLGEALKAAF